LPLARLLPPALRPGDLIGVCAPASPIREDALARGEDALAARGFRLRRAPGLLGRTRYTAGSLAERLADLVDLLVDPDVRGIVFARGGYGSMHLLEHLDPELYARDPKVLVGASDLSFVLLDALERAGLACFHGPMVAGDIAAGSTDLDALVRMVSDPRPFGPITAKGLRALHPGVAEGPLAGGCLSMVTALLGTPYAPTTTGSVLFLEDVAVKPYQIDRMLTHLRLAGKLTAVRAVVFGEMPGCVQHPDQGYELDEVLAELTADLGVPVLAGLPSGHTTGNSQTLPLGVTCRVSTSPPELSVVAAAVR